jgi:hypothetical protein
MSPEPPANSNIERDIPDRGSNPRTGTKSLAPGSQR